MPCRTGLPPSATTDLTVTSVFISTIKLGANGSVGICDWETKLVIDTGLNVTDSADADQNNKYNGVKLSMPIWFQVAF